MKKRSKLNAIFFIFIIIPCTFLIRVHATAQPSSGAADRGIKVSVKDVSGNEIPMYSGSYALLIGAGDYTAGWPDLQNIPAELDRVEKTLKKQGFHITRVMNPDSNTLTAAFEKFVDQHGFDVNNRLLFFFSGHGHTRKGGEKGYLVPTDAPHPLKDERGFLQKALSMDQILAWSRQMEAKHALFVFDSCFSGTVFKTKSLPRRPPYISRSTSLPVRQYMTAGDAGEAVPAASVFTPVFLDGLEYGWADLNGDGYVTGTELGIYLQEKVPLYTEQTPQYGKINDYKLSRGDYVFVLKPNAGNCKLKVASTPPGAKVLINGRLKGTSPLELADLTPGRLSVEVQKEGYALFKEQVLIREGRPLEIKATLKEVVSGGIIEISSDVGEASWYLDDVYVGKTPDEMKNIPPGAHRITVKGEGYPDWSHEIQVQNGERVSVQARLRSSGETPASGEARLYVDTEPSDATIRIMNIRPKYSRGISLPPGPYHLNISAPGFVEWDQWITLSEGEEKTVRVQLESFREAAPRQPAESGSVAATSGPKEISRRDGIYVAYTNGIVKNTRTGLEWVAGPDRNTTWDQANAWARTLTLDGGGWRLPTKEEIKRFYKRGAGTCNMTPLMRTTAWWVWTGETKGTTNAWIFYFSHGYGYWLNRKTSDNLRAFAVRSGAVDMDAVRDTAAQFKRNRPKPVVKPYRPQRPRPIPWPPENNRKNSDYPRTPENDLGP